MFQKIKYFLRSIAHLSQRKKCPYCGGTKFKTVDRKFIVTSLLLCENCHLMHRYPKDSREWLREFYQSEYSIDNCMTSVPADDELQKMRQNSFSSLRNFDPYINALFERRVKIIDYGCSWGYNVYKLLRSGHDASGFEISVNRAKFGEQHLGVKIYTKSSLLPSKNDVIFSSHVIEHLDNIREFISLAKILLNNDGLFIAFCPNGSEEFRKRESMTWHLNWGAVHPNYLNIDFAKYAFRNNPYLLLTGDWEYDQHDIKQWDGMSQIVGSYASGKELLIIAKPNQLIRMPEFKPVPASEISEMPENVRRRTTISLGIG